jgi:hypothetical protein
MMHSIFTPRRHAGALLLWAISALCCLARPVLADPQFACVRCSGPDQTYRCNAMSDEAIPADAVRFFCMSQIAREHVHESCAIVRAASGCNGVDVNYVYQDGVGDQPGDGDREDTAAAKARDEPGTLADMTRSTVDASVKAGKAVGEATQRTLKCLGAALNGC